jgi:hypothetical protein
MEFRKSRSITARVDNLKWDNRSFTFLLISLVTKRIREMEHVTRVEKKKINANCLLDSKCQGRRPLRRLRREVQGIRWRIILNLILKKCDIVYCTLTSFITLRMRSEGNAPKMENQLLVSPSRQCSNTPVGFGRGFLIEDQ